MKVISLEEAHEILSNASAVFHGDNVLVYPSLSKLTGDEHHTFLRLCDSTEGEDLKFKEGTNQEVQISGTSMWLREINDEPTDLTQLTVLVPQQLE